MQSAPCKEMWPPHMTLGIEEKCLFESIYTSPNQGEVFMFIIVNVLFLSWCMCFRIVCESVQAEKLDSKSARDGGRSMKGQRLTAGGIDFFDGKLKVGAQLAHGHGLGGALQQHIGLPHRPVLHARQRQRQLLLIFLLPMPSGPSAQAEHQTKLTWSHITSLYFKTSLQSFNLYKSREKWPAAPWLIQIRLQYF